MLRIPRRAPLLVAALLKQPCCRAFALFTAVRNLPSNYWCAQQERELAAGWTMAPKRGHWQKKKEERSRSFAKRGRVGGWGAYGHQTEGAAAAESSSALSAAATGANAKGAGKAKPPGNHRGTRRAETVHAGSYAGELGATLSEERRQLLKERFEQDDKEAARQKEEQEKNRQAAPPPSSFAEGASAETAAPGGPVVGPNGEGGVASSSSKKKVALLISYWGSDYQGLQMNQGAKTIESELELALYLAGSISKDNFGNPRKIGWARAGRTDKGVHAAAQLISVKLTYPNDGEKETTEAINSYLPKDIRVIDIKRAPKSFDSRTRCSGRRYEYMMPTFVLAPKEHIAALFEEALEWEKSQGGSGGGDGMADGDNAETTTDDFSSVAGDSTRAGAAQVAGGTPMPAGPESAVSGMLGGDASVQAAAVDPAEAGSSEACVETGSAVSAGAAGGGQDRTAAGAQEVGGGGYDRNSGRSDNNEDGDDNSDGSHRAEEEDEGKEERLRLAAVELSSPAVVRRVAEKLKGYRLPADRTEELRETLKGFLGTKNYHNYTNHKTAADPSCKRVITSFTVADSFEDDGMEWIRLTVVGQSFVMHQIRKMVASTVDRVRGQSNKQDFTKSFFAVKMNLGIAPSDGLYLERPLYEPYNAHAKRAGADDRVLEWESGPAAESLEEFKKNSIQSGILAKEHVDHDFVAWLDRIIRYPCAYDY